MSAPEPTLAAFVQDSGLAAADEEGDWLPLAGGVSSDIWHVSLRSGDYCVKRALARLKVAADWSAPLDRNAHEWDYMRAARLIVPESIPTPVAHDPQRGLFAMAWLAPDRHVLWKSELLSGRVDRRDAARVGDMIGRIHAATARDPEIPSRFATDHKFRALRIEPYLLATAAKHPHLADRIGVIADRTATTKHVLVHGDVSPKNILLGPDGPVLLDAECAWFGDPAFDLAFCLNHLLIKARLRPAARDELAGSAAALRSAYFGRVDWEQPEDLAGRAATLLPALALARVDGKSPLEYLSASDRDTLRIVSSAAIVRGDTDLERVSRGLLD